MSAEDLNAKLNIAKGHLKNGRDAASASKTVAHTIWETVDRLESTPNHLYVFQPPSPHSPKEGTSEVTPQDITITVDAAATGFSQAQTELSGVVRGTSNEHIAIARERLNNAVGLLREADGNATTQAKLIEANIGKLTVGVEAVIVLLNEMIHVAYSLEDGLMGHARYTKGSIEAIESYQKENL